jgi:hypothetical protein
MCVYVRGWRVVEKREESGNTVGDIVINTQPVLYRRQEENRRRQQLLNKSYVYKRRRGRAVVCRRAQYNVLSSFLFGELMMENKLNLNGSFFV